jgi:ribosomal-protein-alanine N-acetyltransferase
MIKHRGVPLAEVDEAGKNAFHLDRVATQLQHRFSMPLSEFVVKYPGFPLPYFFCHGLPLASKYAKIKGNKMMKRYAIRRVRAEDLDRIMEIELASFGRDAYDRNRFAEYTRRCGELFLVAEGSGRILGYALTCLAARERAELVSVAVDPAARGTGAAKALMDSTLRRLRPRGVTRLGLMVKVTNERARAFYERCGFTKIRIVRAYYEDGQDGWLMAKHL